MGEGWGQRCAAVLPVVLKGTRLLESKVLRRVRESGPMRGSVVSGYYISCSEARLNA